MPAFINKKPYTQGTKQQIVKDNTIMGVTFRSGDYIRHVYFGGRTIKDGEAATIWNSQGVQQEIIGPKRVHLLFSTVRFLTRFKAEPNQYLVVKYRDGRVEHIQGPTMLFLNPSKHDEVFVKDCLLLKSPSDFIIVFQDQHNNRNEGSKVNKNLLITCSRTTTCSSNPDDEISSESCSNTNLMMIHGPVLFTPTPTKHIHEFCWSRLGGDISTGIKKFQILRSSATPLDVTVNFPLCNGHHLQVKLHIEYRIFSSVTLDTTLSLSILEKLIEFDDPIARIYRALLADAQKIGNQLSLDMVDEWKWEKINDIFNNIDSYFEMSKTAKESGLEIVAISLVDHSLNSELKALFDKERNLSLGLSSEIRAKAHRQELQALEQGERMKEIEDTAKLRRIQMESDTQIEQEMHSQQIDSLLRKAELDSTEAKGKNDIRKMKDGTLLSFLEQLKTTSNVDLTQLLVSIYDPETQSSDEESTMHHANSSIDLLKGRAKKIKRVRKGNPSTTISFGGTE